MQIFQMQSSLQFEEHLEQMHVCIYLILKIFFFQIFFGEDGGGYSRENSDRALMSSAGTGFTTGQRGHDSSGEDFEERL